MKKKLNTWLIAVICILLVGIVVKINELNNYIILFEEQQKELRLVESLLNALNAREKLQEDNSQKEKSNEEKQKEDKVQNTVTYKGETDTVTSKKDDSNVSHESDLIRYGSYLKDFKDIYIKENWTQDQREKLLALYLLILKDQDSVNNYYEYLNESPDITINALLEGRSLTKSDYQSLIQLKDIPDGSVSDAILSYINKIFIEDSETLFKVNYYSYSDPKTLSEYIFPYDRDVYSQAYKTEMLRKYDEIIQKSDLETSFRDYVKKEKKQAKKQFGM